MTSVDVDEVKEASLTTYNAEVRMRSTRDLDETTRQV